MTIGQLRHRLTIQAITASSKNSYGERIETVQSSSESVTVWGSVDPLMGRELEAARQVESMVTHRIMIRYRSGVTPRSQVVHKTRTFEIESIQNPGERNDWLTLMCKEST